jgi:hypothetical protein
MAQSYLYGLESGVTISTTLADNITDVSVVDASEFVVASNIVIGVPTEMFNKLIDISFSPADPAGDTSGYVHFNEEVFKELIVYNINQTNNPLRGNDGTADASYFALSAEDFDGGANSLTGSYVVDISLGDFDLGRAQADRVGSVYNFHSVIHSIQQHLGASLLDSAKEEYIGNALGVPDTNDISNRIPELINTFDNLGLFSALDAAYATGGGISGLDISAETTDIVFTQSSDTSGTRLFQALADAGYLTTDFSGSTMIGYSVSFEEGFALAFEVNIAGRADISLHSAPDDLSFIDVATGEDIAGVSAEYLRGAIQPTTVHVSNSIQDADITDFILNPVSDTLAGVPSIRFKVLLVKADPYS